MKKDRILGLLFVWILTLPSGLFAQGRVVVEFNVQLESKIPAGDILGVTLEQWACELPEFLPMTQISDTTWTARASNERCMYAFMGDTVRYRYSRNFVDGLGAHESFGEGELRGWREIEITQETTRLDDTVSKWRWLPDDGEVPEINTEYHQTEKPSHLPRSEFLTAIVLPDFWWPGFAEALPSALDRIVERTKTELIVFAPICAISQFYPYPVISCEGASPEYELTIPEEDLIRLIEEAHARGLKVCLAPSPEAIGVTDPNPANHTQEWWTAYEAAWRPAALYYAELAESQGVEMLSFSMWPGADQISETEVPYIDPLAVDLVQDIRSAFSGQIIMSVGFTNLHFGLEVFGLADFLSNHGINYASIPSEFSDPMSPTIPELLSAARTLLASEPDGAYYPYFRRWQRPLILHLGYASYTGAAVLDLAGEADIAPWEEDNPAFVLNLQEQADAFEAATHIASEVPWVHGVFVHWYWYADSVDKDHQIRGKPVEAVLRKWNQWLRPDSVVLRVLSSRFGRTSITPGSYLRNSGEVVEIFAVPNPGYSFLRWEGDVSQSTNSQNPLAFTIESDSSLLPIFKESPRLAHGRAGS